MSVPVGLVERDGRLVPGFVFHPERDEDGNHDRVDEKEGGEKCPEAINR